MSKNAALGKGLNALFQENEIDNVGNLTMLRISDIEPNKNQPRKNFDTAALQELADSIKEHGLLQPIVVRSVPGGVYQIIAGERRWRACKLAEITEIQVIIIEADDQKVLELAMIENLQRKDLSPIEEAMGYRDLMYICQMTQEALAKRLGKSRSVIANTVRLLSLPERAIDELNEGNITAGHGKVLAGFVENEEILNILLDKVIVESLSVNQLEEFASDLKHRLENPQPAAPVEQNTWGEAWYKEVETSLRDVLGRRVKVRKKGKAGSIEIQFHNKEELEDLARLLGKYQSTK